MPNERKDREEALLDFHLDRLTDDQRTWIESELLRDAELRAKSDRLRAVLRPLDHWTVPSVAGNLVDRVLKRVAEQADAEQDETLKLVPSLPAERSGGRRGPFRSMRELVAVAACIGLLMVTAFPAVSVVRARSQRAACASNLGAIFRGTTLYQQAFGGALPYAAGPAKASWLPGGCKSNPFASNSRHIFLVAKLNYGPTPANFICPSSRSDRPMQPDELSQYNDFSSSCNMSYATMNMTGYDPSVRRSTRVAFVSDPNPLFRAGRFDSSVEPTTNSRAHGAKGQTVLILDGSVIYMKSPIYGAHRDNLWLAGQKTQYIGTESSLNKDDAFLIPGYPSTCPKTRSQF